MHFTPDELKRLATAVAFSLQINNDPEDLTLLTKLELMGLTGHHVFFDWEGKVAHGLLQQWGQNNDGTLYAVILHDERLHTVEPKTVAGISVY